jgi:16S rRNA processing protein RimM
MRVELLTDWPDRLTAGSELYVEGDDVPRRLAATEMGGRVPVLQLDGVDTREAAAALADTYLEVVAQPLPEGEYYWHELEGLRVVDEAGTELGTLVEVFRAGGGEVYRIEGNGAERLLPALRRVIRGVDLEAGVMVVRPDEED